MCPTLGRLLPLSLMNQPPISPANRSVVKPLDHSGGHFSALMAACNDPVIALDATGTVTDLNSAAQSLLNKAKTSVVGKSASAIFKSFEAGDLSAALHKLLESRTPQSVRLRQADADTARKS